MRDTRPILLLTRPLEGSELFAKAAQARFGERIEVAISPLQKIEWINADRNFSGYEGLIFTSKNGVLSWNRDKNKQFLHAFSVGPRTTETAREFGLNAVDGGGDAESLFDTIVAKKPKAPLLHIRGEHGVGNLAARLTEVGIPTDELIAYRQVAEDPSPSIEAILKSDRPVIAPLFSPRSVSLFQEAMPDNTSPWLAVISPNAAERVDVMLRRRMMVATSPNATAMLDLVEEIIDRLSSP